MILKGGISRKQALAEDAFKGFELHVDALSVILEVGYGLEGLPTVGIATAERAYTISVRQEMVLQVLFLLEGLVAAGVCALELPLMTLKVPIKLTLADELLVRANWALKL